jgi:recombination protein RecA
MAKLTALEKFAYIHKEKLPTGIDPLDTILNNGPEQGDLIGIASKEGGGKSTMLLQLSKIYIEEYGFKVAYIDVERGVKTEILSNMGLDKHIADGNFFMTNSISTYSDISELLDEIIASPENYGMLVIDSITALVPTSMLEKDTESNEMALKARAMSRFLDKYRGALANKNIATFVVVQYRKNLSQTYPGAPEFKTASPQALMHACDVILHITTSNSKDRAIYDMAVTPDGIKETKVGATHYLWAEKNKHAMPNIKVNFPVKYGQEISNFEYLMRLLKDKGLIKRGGSWIKEVAGTEVSLQGEAALIEYVEQNYDALREQLFNSGAYDLLSLVSETREEGLLAASVEEIGE